MMQERRRRTVAGFSCGQLLLLSLFVIVIALTAGLVFGYSLGLFDSFLQRDKLPVEPTLTESNEPTGAASADASPEASTQQFQTTTTALESTSTPADEPATETPSLPATETTTPTTPPTVPANVCTQVDLDYLNVTSNIVAWRLSNDSGQAFILNRIEITWPGSNDAIFNAFLDGEVIWSGQDLVSPTIITTWFGEHSNRVLGTLSRLEFFFGTNAASSGYDLTIGFENGCVVSQSR
jgi:hypothetical protein